MVEEGSNVEHLLEQARKAAEGREAWRQSGPIWRQLLDLHVPYDRITEATGVSPATFARVARAARRGTSRTSPKPNSTDPT